MPTQATLLLFCAAVLGLLLSPGPNMALVISQSLAGGVGGGLASAAGICVADLLMTALVCAGVAGLAAAWPPSFDLLRYAGAVYLAGLALAGLRRRGAPRFERAATQPLPRLFRSAVIVSLLNPKALLFFLVFLPQFADPRRGGVTAQLALFGLLLSAIALLFHALLGLASGRVAAVLRRRDAASLRWLDRLQAGVLIGLALRLLLLDRPAHA
ncbi:LysE family translocator [Tahibacter caeni]|uniref:LysE family translocator n=1 Tax=Tahibacter caeni TaxID=1453545 RepID=UPI0021478780|nr:LysE family translocator [Tahibacter caeni]